MKDLDPPTRRLHHNDLLCGIRRWRATGFGIDPNQPALRHRGGKDCRCHWCVGTPIATTEPIRWPA